MDGKYGQLYTQDDVLRILNAVKNGEGIEGMGPESLLSMALSTEGVGDALTFPAVEPVFLIRGKDECGAEAVHEYRFIALAHNADEAFLASVEESEAAFAEFARSNPDDMKVPD